jgi:transposase InsO family protein
LCLAGLKNLYSGEIVAYAMGDRMTRHLVMQALFRAVSLRRPAPSLIQHADRLNPPSIAHTSMVRWWRNSACGHR